MTNRLLDNWIESYLYFTRHHIAAEHYHLWTALGVLSAAVNSNRWMDGGYYKTFPNLYILFIGPSGIGKSTSSGIGLEIIKEAQLKTSIFTDSLTAAGLVEFMSFATVTWEYDGVVNHKTPVLIYASEIGNLITKRNSIEELTLLLTELFNKNVDYESRSKTGGKTIIKKPNVTFFACCFPEWVDEVLNTISLRSGFLGRILVVRSTKKRFKDNKVLSGADWELRAALVHDLKIISSQYGEMDWTPRAKYAWDKWTDGLPLDLTSDETIEVQGFASRKAQYVQRLAMLHAIAKKDTLNKIRHEDFIFGRENVDHCEKHTRKLKVRLNHTAHMEKIRGVMLNIRSKTKSDIIAIRDIMPRVFRQMKKDEVEEAIEMLCQIGFCKMDGRKLQIVNVDAGE